MAMKKRSIPVRTLLARVPRLDAVCRFHSGVTVMMVFAKADCKDYYTEVAERLGKLYHAEFVATDAALSAHEHADSRLDAVRREVDALVDEVAKYIRDHDADYFHLIEKDAEIILGEGSKADAETIREE